MKKIIVLPDATGDMMFRLTEHIRDMKDDDTIIVNKDIKIYNIDNAELWTKEQVKEFAVSYGLKLDESG
ncbi:MAG TPA: hypothetical protein VLE21_04745 [Candidatus Nitrosocosmicus sp.]|nr:hypothetical protein [Candidatus Nitrosocosmicus sp.]